MNRILSVVRSMTDKIIEGPLVTTNTVGIPPWRRCDAFGTYLTPPGWDRMNRILSVVRSMTDKIIELSRGVVTAPIMGKVTAESESISSTCR